MSTTIVSQLNSVSTHGRGTNYGNGNYVEQSGESPLVGKSMYLSNNYGIAVVGDKKDPGKQLLDKIYSKKKFNFTDEYSSFGQVRDLILKYEKQRDSCISFVAGLDIKNDGKDFTFEMMSSSFFSGFTPFNPEDQTPNSYYNFRYLTSEGNLANNPKLFFEEHFAGQGKPLNISVAFTQRSNYEYKESSLVDVMDQIFPLFVVIIYTLPFMYLLQRAVEEKQTKTRESMRMMGMIDSAYFTSWFIAYFFQILAVTLIMTIGSIFTLFGG